MKPSRILMTPMGSFGDVHPYMALALELTKRGHTATIGTAESYREKIETAGLPFVAIRPNIPHGPEGDEMVRRVMDRKTGGAAILRDLVMSNIRETHADTLEAARGCDLIVSHVLTYSSPIAAEQLSIPWIFAALQPLIFFSADDPSVPAPAPWLVKLRVFGPKFYRKMLRLGLKMAEPLGEPLYDLRRELNLPSAKSPIFDGQYSPHLNLALFSRFFAPPAPDWPQPTVQSGFVFYDGHDNSQRPMPTDLLRFLDGGEEPIVFTLGTAAVRSAGDFFHQSIAAVRRLKRRAVVLTGIQTGNEEDLTLGDDIFVADYAPYAELFPRAAINVHQGGIGTTAQALRAGKPMLIMPYAHDQPDNAHRCERLGVAKHLSRDRYNERTAARALFELLNDAGTARRASEIGANIRGESGTATACDAIEALLAKS